jgi:hypothetical protein
MTSARFAEICRMGDRFLLERFGIQHFTDDGSYHRSETPSRIDFDRELDDFGMAECGSWSGAEVNVLVGYVLAAAGFRPVPPTEHAHTEQQSLWNR